MESSKTVSNSSLVNNRDISNEATSSLSAWPVVANHYTLLGKVGRGAFATVYKASTSVSASNNVNHNHNLHKPLPGTSSLSSSLCAIKIINLELVDTNFVDIRLEVQTMRLSSHPNILACYTSFIHHTNLWLVMQLMDKGSSLHCLQTARMIYNPLNQEFKHNQMHSSTKSGDDASRILFKTEIHRDSKQHETQLSSPLEGESDKIKLEEEEKHRRTNKRRIINMEQHITYILHETLLGLQYIHDNGQIHRDIKAGNILLDSHGNVVVADFGVSGWLVNEGSQRENTRTFVGTPCWMAPEVMEQIHGYDTKADIWSLGITALELAKGHAPYAKYPPMKVLLLTIQEDPPSLQTYVNNDDDEHFDENNADVDDKGLILIKEDWSDSFKAMIAWCLQKDPRNRPNCEELLAHEHFAPLRDKEIRRENMIQLKEDICDQIDDVGGDINFSSAYANSIPNTNVSAGLGTETRPKTLDSDGDNDATLGRNNNSTSLPEEICGVEQRPSGTTWIFSDGSQVTASASGCSVNSTRGAETAVASGPNHTTDQHGDFFDQFEQATQGEDFKHPSVMREEEEATRVSNLRTTCTNQEQVRSDGDSDKDDLNAFMDQFEEQTSQRELS